MNWFELKQRFTAIDSYAHRHGFVAGWPTFDSRRASDQIVYGNLLMRDGECDWRDVPESDLRNLGWEDYDSRTFFAAAHDYARANGYGHGFPTFHYATYNDTKVWGIHLIHRGVCEFRDVPASELIGTVDPWQDQRPMNVWFNGAHLSAPRFGFGTGLPTGHVGGGDGNWVCGVMFVPGGKAEWRDIRGRELGLADISPVDPKPPPRNASISLTLVRTLNNGLRYGESHGPDWPNVVTSITNESRDPIHLGLLMGDRLGPQIVFIEEVLPAGYTSNKFNNQYGTSRWVGTSLASVTGDLGPIRIEVREKI